jgi:uncharacterized protein involved in exopolysaccharide biosynthesis
MSILQVLRILWARRLLILAATVSCVIGAWVVTLILPPSWPGQARVILNTIKPDPVTGQVMQMGANRSYVQTQVELVTDPSVAARVAEQLGWTSDPNWIAAYQSRSSNDKRDFRRWLAQQVIDRTSAELVEGSNILAITYNGTTPEEARIGADALRSAYMNKSLELRRDDANRNADWYDQQAVKAQASLEAAEAQKAAFEKQSGVVLSDKDVDLDTQRLQVLAMQGAAGGAAGAPIANPNSNASQLAEVDAQLAAASKNLGPNHPEILALKARRATLAALVAQDQKNFARLQAGAAASAARANADVVDRAIQQQKERVLAQHDKIAHLHQLQGEVDRLRDLYDRTAAKAVEFRQEAAASIDNLTPLGTAAAPKAPSFPNMLLIIPGAIVFGLGLGGMTALLWELFWRRVRGTEDLAAVEEAPLLAVLPGLPAKNEGAFKRWGRNLQLPTRTRALQP